MLKNIIAKTNSGQKSFDRYSCNEKAQPSQFEDEGQWELESFKQYELELQNKYPHPIEENNQIIEQPYLNDIIYKQPSDAIDSSM